MPSSRSIDVTWSSEARVIRHPFQLFLELGAAPESTRPMSSIRARWWRLARRPLFYLLFMGASISIITAGRLVAWHMLFIPIAWSFVPIYMAGITALILRFMAPQRPRAQAIDQFFITVTPWYLLFAFIALVMFLSPDVYATFRWMLFPSFILPLAVVGTFAWSIVLTFAFFRAAIGFERRRARLATILYYGSYIGLICGYYLATYQIQQFILRE